MDKKRGRPTVDKSRDVTRSWKMPRTLYERLQVIAEKEQRDTTKQVVKILQDFADGYEKAEKSPGNITPMPLDTVRERAA